MNSRLDARFDELFTQVPVGVALVDSRSGCFLEVNPAFAEITGRGAGTLTRLSWKDITHSDDLEQELELVAKMNSGAMRGYRMEKRYLRPDGSSVWAKLTVGPVQPGEGGAPRHLCMIEDVTKLKQAEEEAANARRLESLGTLAAGIAHDFNNHLTAILGNLSLLRPRLSGGGDSMEILDEAQDSCAAAKDLANRLLTFSKDGRPVAEVMDLRPVVSKAAEAAARGTNSRCVFELGDAPLAASIDKDQIERVIHGLIANAAQAMPRGGEVVLRGELAGGRVRLTVADQGSGIAPEHLPRIFEPYFTTKGLGRGLGLATCYSIMTKHGGEITAEASPGGGAVFTLLFRAAAPAAQTPEPATAARAEGGRLLVMDDEASVARTLKRLLEHLGYRVETVPDGRAAIASYRAALDAGTPFDAVILDLTVRDGMGGLEAMARIRALVPGAKGIVTTGYAYDPITVDFAAEGFREALVKPYRLEEVSAVVRRVVGPPDAVPPLGGN